MRPYSAYDSDTCSIARTLDLVGDRWTLLVLRDVVNGVGRFDIDKAGTSVKLGRTGCWNNTARRAAGRRRA